MKALRELFTLATAEPLYFLRAVVVAVTLGGLCALATVNF